jgi:WS/DGAT/MGAT family acyltransferase
MGDERGNWLSQNDTIMWTVEADPLLRSTIVGIAHLDHAPDWDRVRRRVQHAVAMVPGLRRRVEAVPLHPSTLRWVDDGDLDLSHHLRRVRLPDAATMQDALDLIRGAATAGLDRARPLWHFTLVEGLPDGSALWAMTAHHVLTDGIGSVQLAAHLFDLDADAAMPDTPEADRAAPRPDTMHAFVEAVQHDVELATHALQRGVAGIVPGLIGAIRHPRRTVDDAVELARSVGRLVAPVTETLSPVMTDRHLGGTYRTLTVPVADLHRAARRHDAHLNDAFLAGITGGMRRYHELHEADVGHLRVAMPISLRTADDAAGGNHVTVMRFVVPVDVTDPGFRMRSVRDQVRGLRDERSIAHTELIAGALNAVPTGVIGAMLKHVDFLASNVPGVPVPLYLAGSPVRSFTPFGPTAGSAVNITLMSYDGICCIGVNVDTAAIPDPDEFLACLAAGFDEVIAEGLTEMPVPLRSGG